MHNQNLSIRRQKIALRQNTKLKEELREWQDVMFEAEVPELMISFIGI